MLDRVVAIAQTYCARRIQGFCTKRSAEAMRRGRCTRNRTGPESPWTDDRLVFATVWLAAPGEPAMRLVLLLPCTAFVAPRWHSCGLNRRACRNDRKHGGGRQCRGGGRSRARGLRSGAMRVQRLLLRRAAAGGASPNGAATRAPAAANPGTALTLTGTIKGSIVRPTGIGASLTRGC